MPISSLFKRCYVFLNLTQIHRIFRRHIILTLLDSSGLDIPVQNNYDRSNQGCTDF